LRLGNSSRSSPSVGGNPSPSGVVAVSLRAPFRFVLSPLPLDENFFCTGSPFAFPSFFGSFLEAFLPTLPVFSSLICDGPHFILCCLPCLWSPLPLHERVFFSSPISLYRSGVNMTFFSHGLFFSCLSTSSLIPPPLFPFVLDFPRLPRRIGNSPWTTPPIPLSLRTCLTSLFPFFLF